MEFRRSLEAFVAHGATLRRLDGEAEKIAEMLLASPQWHRRTDGKRSGAQGQDGVVDGALRLVVSIQKLRDEFQRWLAVVVGDDARSARPSMLWVQNLDAIGAVLLPLEIFVFWQQCLMTDAGQVDDGARVAYARMFTNVDYCGAAEFRDSLASAYDDVQSDDLSRRKSIVITRHGKPQAAFVGAAGAITLLGFWARLREGRAQQARVRLRKRGDLPQPPPQAPKRRGLSRGEPM